MKALKIIGMIVGAIITLVLVLHFIAPADFHTELSMTIDAPKELVFNNIKYWQKWHAWSPWAEQDPSMKVTLSGEDGKVGAVYQWEGDPEITGSGSMTATAIKANEEIVFHMRFLVPWESESDGYMRVSETQDGKTKVTWAFYGENKFPLSIMMLFMDMDEMMGPVFESGLTLLKNISEKQARAISQYQVEEIEWPGKIFATLRRTVSTDNIARFFAESYQKIGIENSGAGARMTGMPCGLYYSWDEQNKETNLAAAIPVNRKYKGEKIETIEIGPQKAYMVNFYGSYQNLAQAHLALHVHLAKIGIEPRFPCLEEYATDPGGEPDPSKWLTKVYYFAKN
jgi:effector-binding domain-containing protein/uncharacterized protein YndB with AHSA1/START domain